MEERNGFSIYENTTPTNQDIAVTYTPDSSITRYQYRVVKDGIEEDYVKIENADPTTIYLTSTGNYQIIVQVYQQNGRMETVRSGVFKIDKEKPIIDVGERNIEMQLGSTLEPLAGITVYDRQDGDLISQVTTNYDELDFSTKGIKTLTYTVSDQAGNTTSESIYIHVVGSTESELLIVQLGIIFILGIVIILTLFYQKSMRREKRIGKFGIEPLEDNTPSLIDQANGHYNKFIQRLKKGLVKSVFLQKYAKRYEKYVGVIDNGYESGLDFVINKFIVSLIFVLIAVFSKTIQYQLLSLYEVCIPMLFGFFMPDFIYIYRYRRYREQLENDLLQAIIVMNNAFKSGRSITQAIDLVTKELDGPIASEFKKMSVELSFGLSLDDVFKRFSDRIQLEEVAYMTASLSILNKTGGNIIQVFSSIEKSLFNKKKLKLELSALTGSSKIIMYVLFCVPILFIAFISILNPSYFDPFFTTQIGWIMMILILIMYISYIMIVRRVMRVRM